MDRQVSGIRAIMGRMGDDQLGDIAQKAALAPGLMERIRELQAEANKLQAQRDTLVAAAKAALPTIPGVVHEGMHSWRVNHERNALAEAVRLAEGGDGEMNMDEQDGQDGKL